MSSSALNCAIYSNPEIAALLENQPLAVQQALLLAFPPQDLVQRNLASEETIKAMRNSWAAEGGWYLILWIAYTLTYFVYNPIDFAFFGVFFA
jgi:hypothetical protein